MALFFAKNCHGNTLSQREREREAMTMVQRREVDERQAWRGGGGESLVGGVDSCSHGVTHG